MYRVSIVAIIIVALTIGGTYYLHRRGYLKTAEMVGGIPEVILQLDNVHTVGRSNGTKTWSVKAKRAEISRTRVHTTLYDVEDGIIYEDNEPVARLSAGKAVYNDVDRSLEMSGGIVVETHDGTIITTPDARYNSWQKTLTCPEKVGLKTKKSTAEADSMTANLQTNEVDAKILRMKVELDELEKILEVENNE